MTRSARRRFLSRCSVHGAISRSPSPGAATGKRQLPLMIDDTDWDALTDRIYLTRLRTSTPPTWARCSAAIDQAVRRSDRNRDGTWELLPSRPLCARATRFDLGRRRGPGAASRPRERWLALAGSLKRPHPTAPSPPDLTRTWAELFPAVHARPRRPREHRNDSRTGWPSLTSSGSISRPNSSDCASTTPSRPSTTSSPRSSATPTIIHPAAHDHVIQRTPTNPNPQPPGSTSRPCTMTQPTRAGQPRTQPRRATTANRHPAANASAGGDSTSDAYSRTSSRTGDNIHELQRLTRTDQSARPAW